MGGRIDINELLEMQKNKPTPEEPMYWAYSFEEGGTWKYFRYPASPSAIKRMEKEVTNPLNWGRYKLHAQGTGSLNYTVVRTIPPFTALNIFALKFPDRRVWDSQLRTFTHDERKEIR